MTKIRGLGSASSYLTVKCEMMNVCADSWGLAPSCQNNLLCLSEDRHGRAVSRLTITMSPCQHSSNLKKHAYKGFLVNLVGMCLLFHVGPLPYPQTHHASNMSNPMWKEPSCAHLSMIKVSKEASTLPRTLHSETCAVASPMMKCQHSKPNHGGNHLQPPFY